jgi:hypothetical protein
MFMFRIIITIINMFNNNNNIDIYIYLVLK